MLTARKGAGSLLPSSRAPAGPLYSPTSADAASPRCPGRTGTKPQPTGTYVKDDTFVQQALLLGCHDKVVGTVLVVNNVLEINP